MMQFACGLSNVARDSRADASGRLSKLHHDPLAKEPVSLTGCLSSQQKQILSCELKGGIDVESCFGSAYRFATVQCRLGRDDRKRSGQVLRSLQPGGQQSLTHDPGRGDAAGG